MTPPTLTLNFSPLNSPGKQNKNSFVPAVVFSVGFSGYFVNLCVMSVMIWMQEKRKLKKKTQQV